MIVIGRRHLTTVWCVALLGILVGCQSSPSERAAGSGTDVASLQATTGWVVSRVDAGGHMLNVNCRGGGSPAIVFENGLGDNLGTWFETGVAPAFPLVRTCAYDRVNTGTSDRVPTRHTGRDSVRELHKIMTVTATPAPRVLVGHSFGGLLAAMYAGTYPAAVTGLVLVDPSLPADVETYRLIPERERISAMAQEERNPERVDFFDTLRQAEVLVPKAVTIPVCVLASTRGGAVPPGWPAADVVAARKKALREFTAQFPRGELRFVDSGHYIQTEQPKLVIGAIQRILEIARDSSR
ncbi:alpha/beta hydrolase [Pilimelia terevasa]|uniref:Alpha/beta hydrolase n=1 Tax=Pilimelia terevasa TaxID=53372 RepID=A0A8J3BT10_9ACTN|nr:alpha/beta fold hydrolase [Pilimelia terevasa]GGK38413.1 alpha/beta hydrolase [Pilimelia terevasa]